MAVASSERSAVAGRAPSSEFRRRLDTPLAPAVVVLSLGSVFVALRWAVVAKRSLGAFVVAGAAFTSKAQAPKGLPVLRAPNHGYDGQFFYRLALDPANLHRTAFGITLDAPFRAQRIGYPVLAWLVALGQRPWVPAALVVVNVAAISTIALLAGCLSRQAGRHALWGLVVAGYCGFLFSVARDTAEAVAMAFLLGGLLAYRRGWWLVAGALIAAAALSRESALVAVGAIAVVRLWTIASGRARPAAKDMSWLVPVAAFAGWQVVVRLVVGTFPYRSDTQRRISAPLGGLVKGLRENFDHMPNHDYAIWFAEMAVLTAVVATAVLAARRSSLRAHEKLAFFFYLVQTSMLPVSVWDDVADLRQLDEVYVFAVLVLLYSSCSRTMAAQEPTGWRRARLSRPAWRDVSSRLVLPAVAVLAAATCGVVAAHRILAL